MSESVLSDGNNYANEWRILPQSIIENIFYSRKFKLVHKFQNLMVGGDRNKPAFNIVETWYVYKKES